MRQIGSSLLLMVWLLALGCSHQRATRVTAPNSAPNSETAALTSAVASLQNSVNQLQLQVHQLSEGVASLKQSTSPVHPIDGKKVFSVGDGVSRPAILFRVEPGY